MKSFVHKSCNWLTVVTHIPQIIMAKVLNTVSSPVLIDINTSINYILSHIIKNNKINFIFIFPHNRNNVYNAIQFSRKKNPNPEIGIDMI